MVAAVNAMNQSCISLLTAAGACRQETLLPRHPRQALGLDHIALITKNQMWRLAWIVLSSVHAVNVLTAYQAEFFEHASNISTALCSAPLAVHAAVGSPGSSDLRMLLLLLEMNSTLQTR